MNGFTSSQVLLLTTALNPILFHRLSLASRNFGNWLIQSSPIAQGKISYFSSSSSSSMSLAKYLHTQRVKLGTVCGVCVCVWCVCVCVCEHLQCYKEVESVKFLEREISSSEVHKHHGQQILHTHTHTQGCHYISSGDMWYDVPYQLAWHIRPPRGNLE